MSSSESVMGNGAQRLQMFRTALRGYQKSDVNRYISKMDANFRGVEQTLKNTITVQQNTIDTLQTRTQEQQSALQALQQECEQLRQTLESCRISLADRYAAWEAEQAENARLQQLLAHSSENGEEGKSQASVDLENSDAQMQALRSQIVDLQEQLAKAQTAGQTATQTDAAYAVLEEKAAQYDMITQSMGSWMRAADEKASAVLTQARQQAHALEQQAQEKSNRLLQKSLEQAKQARQACSMQLHRLAQGACADAKDKLTALQLQIDELAAQFDAELPPREILEMSVPIAAEEPTERTDTAGE